MFSVTDDSGFLALVDPHAYRGYVHKDWDWGMLRKHFTNEMQSRHLLIWGTGKECIWQVSISFHKTEIKPFREIIGSIISTKGHLLITNYESLTIAAQFPDISLPEPHQKNNIIQVMPGLYNCRIAQIYNPDNNELNEDNNSFSCDITPSSQVVEAWNEIPWYAV